MSNRQVRSTCPYCGVGCGIVLNIDEADRIRWVDDDPANRSSQGMLCVKGRFGTTFVNHPDRLTTPLIRRNGQLQQASWDEALDAGGRAAIARIGDSLAASPAPRQRTKTRSCSRNSLRLVMGTNNIDHCTRLCHSPTVDAMLQHSAAARPATRTLTTKTHRA